MQVACQILQFDRRRRCCRFFEAGREPPTRRTRSARSLLFCLACATGIGFAPAASGIDGDTLTGNVFATERYDSNLFNLADGVQPPGDGSRSATVRSTGAGLHFDHSYGLQRIYADASVYHIAYHPYDYLDITARTYSATLAFSVTPELTGTVSLSRSAVPSSFSDVGFVQTSSVQRSDQSRFDLDFRPGATLHPRIAAFEDKDRSEQSNFQAPNAQTTSVEGSMIYEFRSFNRAEAYFRRGRGTYFEVVDVVQNVGRFDEREVGLRMVWKFSGVSNIDAGIGRLSREHTVVANRDFEGPVGHVTYLYALTGKTTLELDLTRGLTSAQTTFSSYSRDDQIAFRPSWAATGKITVRPSYNYLHRVFLGPIVPGTTTLRETQRDVGLTAEWSIVREVDFTLGVTRSSRVSNDSTLQFVNRSVSATLRFKF